MTCIAITAAVALVVLVAAAAWAVWTAKVGDKWPRDGQEWNDE